MVGACWVVSFSWMDVWINFPMNPHDKVTYGCFRKWWYPQIIHFNRDFHYKPSILGYPYFWKHPYIDFFETFLSFHWVCKTLLIDKIPKQFTRWIIMFFFPTMIPLQSPSPSWTSFCLVIFLMKAEHPNWGGRFWELVTILFWLSSEAAFVLLLV